MLIYVSSMKVRTAISDYECGTTACFSKRRKLTNLSMATEFNQFHTCLHCADLTVEISY
jgi:hypothetical protein